MTPARAPQFQAPPSSAPEFGDNTVVGHHRKPEAAAAGLVVVTEDSPQPDIAGFKPEGSGYRREFGWALLTDMVIDPRIQRPLNAAEVNNIAKNFDPAALGTVTLSARVDNATGATILTVIDGQQRRAGALKAEDKWEALDFHGRVRVDVHYGLTPADEARLFRLLNFRRAVQPIQLFKTALIEGDPDTIAVQRILDKLGIPFGTPRGFSGARASVRLVSRRNGETTLEWALRMVQRIYDEEGKGGCYDAQVVEAFYWLYDQYGIRIDEDNLYHKLSRLENGVSGLIGHARTIKSVRAGKIGVNLIRAILVRYNAGLRSAKTKLPDWTLDSASEAELAEVGSDR